MNKRNCIILKEKYNKLRRCNDTLQPSLCSKFLITIVIKNCTPHIVMFLLYLQKERRYLINVIYLRRKRVKIRKLMREKKLSSIIFFNKGIILKFTLTMIESISQYPKLSDWSMPQSAGNQGRNSFSSINDENSHIKK
jgi:hypothetical protein